MRSSVRLNCLTTCKIVFAELVKMATNLLNHAASIYTQLHKKLHLMNALVIQSTWRISFRRYPCVPGIYTDEQIEGWSKVVDAVKGQGATFFMQIWHVGRTSHSGMSRNPSLQHASSCWHVGQPIFS